MIALERALYSLRSPLKGPHAALHSFFESVRWEKATESREREANSVGLFTGLKLRSNIVYEHNPANIILQ